MPGRCLILPVFLLIAHYCVAHVQLLEEWQVDVPLGAAGLPHPVVCPNGTLYMVGQGGKITVVDRQGKVGSDSHQTVLKAATALACDAQGRLYVASPDFVAVVEPKSTGDYRVVSTGYAKISAYAIAAAEDGRIFVAGRRAGNGFPLHLMTTDGKMIRSFGEGSPNSDPSPVLMDGFLLWNARERRLLMAPRTMPEIQVYSGDGDEVSVKDLGVPQWEDEWIHELWGMAFGPSGRIVIQGLVRAWPPGPTGRFLNVLDRNLNRPRRGLRSPYGILVGSDRDGVLYFVSNRRVRRVRIVTLEDSDMPGVSLEPVL